MKTKDVDYWDGILFEDNGLDYFVTWKQYAKLVIMRQPFFK